MPTLVCACVCGCMSFWIPLEKDSAVRFCHVPITSQACVKEREREGDREEMEGERESMSTQITSPQTLSLSKQEGK